jgi:RNA polymerase sigma-70 factor, ECF subfamily
MDDVEIVNEVLSGNSEAFRHVMTKYKNIVVSIARSHVPPDDVEDNVQEAFLRGYRSLPTFKGADLRPWLSMIAIRTCQDFWRSRYKRNEVQLSPLSEGNEAWLESALAGAAGRWFREDKERKEAKAVLEWAMGRLSAGDRMVLELVYFEDRSVKEAAGLLGLSVVNVKVRLLRARRKLRSLLAQLTAEQRCGR